MLAMEWSDAPASKTLADNLARLGRVRGLENWNQFAVSFRDWSHRRPFVDPISVNTLRNIERRTNAPQASKLLALADFLEVPLFVLFVPDTPAEPDLVMTLNALVATFVNGDNQTREAIRHMISAFSASRTTPRRQASNR